MKRIPILILGCVVLSPMARSAGAHTLPNGAEFPALLRKADFIFRGVVTSVEYKSSRPAGPRGPSLPHTFVTFAIEKVYLPRPTSQPATGDTAPRTITLRFLGGAEDGGRRILDVEGPLFDVGDRDVLLVQGNTRMGCPLTDCALGRFRIIDGLVYSDDGNEVDLASDRDLAFGPPHRLREVDANMVGGHLMEQLVEDPVDESREGGSDAGNVAPGPQMTDGEFDRFLSEVLVATLGDRELERPRRMVSADIAADFVVIDRPQTSPDARLDLAALKPAPPSTDQERNELQQYLNNGGDPRVPR